MSLVFARNRGRTIGKITLWMCISAGIWVSLIALFTLIHVIRTAPAIERASATALVGWNALLITPAFTVPTMGTLLIIHTMKAIKMITLPASAPSAFRTVASWTGYGTVAGATVAALFPLAFLTGPLYDSSSVSIDPGIIIAFPAAGAVVGYIVGLTVTLTVMLETATNLVYSTLLAPALFLALTWSITPRSLSPRSLLEAIASGSPSAPGLCEIPPPDSASMLLFSDPTWTATLVDVCAKELVISGEALAMTITVFVAIVAAWVFWQRLQNRAKAGFQTGTSSP